jgi:short-subunit dehydrogenase
LTLVDARRGGEQDIVHLSYSDGIASVSVFEQRGRLDEDGLAGHRRQAADGHAVWVRGEVPRRVVWSSGGTVYTVVADLGDHQATIELGRQLAHEHPELTLVINNAGVALAGSFTELTLEEFDWLMEINFRAVLTLTHALVPVLLQNQGSHLVNVSSVFGLIAPPSQTAYVTSKFAVRGLTESLRAELLGRVGVTCVHPGGIDTRIAVDARVSEGADPAEIERGLSVISGLLRIPASVAAERILDGVGRRRPRVLIGLSARLPDLLARVAPGANARLLSTLLGAGRRHVNRA